MLVSSQVNWECACNSMGRVFACMCPLHLPHLVQVHLAHCAVSMYVCVCHVNICMCVCVCAHFRTKRLPVLYVFGQEEVSPEACAAAFGEAFPDPEEHVIVFCDVVYTHCMGERFAHSHKVNELQSWF